MCNEVGSWCKQGGIVCDHHKDAFEDLKPLTPCDGLFYGTCEKGSCYTPNDPYDELEKEFLILQCEVPHFNNWYREWIGETIDIDIEFADTVMIKIKGRSYPLSKRDGIIKKKTDVG